MSLRVCQQDDQTEQTLAGRMHYCVAKTSELLEVSTCIAVPKANVEPGLLCFTHLPTTLALTLALFPTPRLHDFLVLLVLLVLGVASFLLLFSLLCRMRMTKALLQA